MNPESLIIFNLLLYLLGFLFLLGLNNSVFASMSGWISLLINVLGLVFTSNQVLNIPGDFQIQYEWLKLGDKSLYFSFLMNAQTKFMLVLVQVVSCLVTLFSTKYMSEDKGQNRFFAFLNLFVCSMLGLVLSGNLFQIYFFWELVGFCSYLLIGFWYTKKAANAAAMKAFLLNRVGDAFLLTGIFLIFYLYGTLDFGDLLVAEVIERDYVVFDKLQLQTIAILLVFGGVIAKSAQFPLQVWLPDAMAGPTPASALIHAATMVVSGVFLLGRLQPLITEDAGLFITFVGCITALVGAVPALVATDLKKVLAFSTLSQLGFMVAAMGMGDVAAAFFHLTTHAFFKAGLFLCAGVIISYLHHEQDMRKMGNLTSKLPIVFYAFLLCSAALVGLPLTSGYLSKETILNTAFIYGLEETGLKTAVPVLLLVSSFFTGMYVVRMIVMVFFKREDNPVDLLIDNTKKTVGGAIKSFQDILTGDNKGRFGEESILSFIRGLGVFELAIIFLAACSTYIVFSSHPLHAVNVWFYPKFGIQKEMYTWLPWVVGGIFIVALLVSYNVTLEEIKRYYLGEGKPKQWLLRQFYMDTLYERGFVRIYRDVLPVFSTIEKKVLDALISGLSMATITFSSWTSVFERKVVDGAVLGSFAGLKTIGDKIRKLAKGQLQNYIMGLILGFVLLVLVALL